MGKICLALLSKINQQKSIKLIYKLFFYETNLYKLVYTNSNSFHYKTLLRVAERRTHIFGPIQN